MKNSARSIALILLCTTGLGLTASALADGGKAKDVCQRSHAYVVKALTTSEKYVMDEVTSKANPIIINPDSVRPEDRATLLNEGLYTQDTPLNDRLLPRFQMGTGNQPGWLNMNLCWWHSRLQRAAAYLVQFDPNSQKPNSEQAIKILRALTFFKSVRLPGYQSIYEFTRDFPNELETVLSEWQIRTTVIAPQHVLGTTLLNFVFSPEERLKIAERSFQNLLDDLDVAPRPIILMAEHPSGFGSHTFMVVGYYVDLKTGDISLSIIDSNQPGKTIFWDVYKNGEFDISEYPGLKAKGFGLIHSYFDEDFGKIEAGLKKVCGSNYQIPID
jgi:hypothetical protein